MKQYQVQWSVKEMARVLGVSRSGYYHYCKRVVSKRRLENDSLQHAIGRMFSQSRNTYGSPRIHAFLKEEGVRCSRPRVARLMRQMKLVAKMRQTFKRTTRVDNKRMAAPNLLQQQFKAPAPNHTWVSDMTYVKTQEGWLYVAIILDVFSRKVVGLSMSDSMHTTLIIKALEQALQRRRPSPGRLQHHSDRGCQYTSEAFQQVLDENKIVCSMSGRGNCYDNAVAESFFHTLKTECVYFQRYENRQQAKESIFEYIEVFYNNQRRHSTLGYLSPTEFERRFYQQLCS